MYWATDEIAVADEHNPVAFKIYHNANDRICIDQYCIYPSGVGWSMGLAVFESSECAEAYHLFEALEILNQVWR